MTYILDASAIIAIIQMEDRGTRVIELIEAEDAYASAVTIGESLAKLVELGMPDRAAMRAISAIVTDVVPFNVDMAVMTGVLREETRAAGLSFADRACLVTALELGVPAITTDRAWKSIDLGVDVRLVA
ncbi:MAG: PilT protein-like protein [Thermoleophilia bacterium]|nr:PilT protein-like protein [Thermoleophilia bacterium]